MKPLDVVGIVLIVFGLFLLIWGLNTVWLCPAENYINGTIVGGCGYAPLIIPTAGIILVVIGAILLAISALKKRRLGCLTQNH